MSGLIIAAPSSGAGKTTVTLALLRLLRRRGIKVRSAKSGPDFIDPRFHETATGAPCPNLDAWAMSEERLKSLANTDDSLLIIEGAMGLFDGAPPNGRGAVADLARCLKLPVVLVVNASHMAQSVAAIVNGFKHHDPRVFIAAVILNNVGSDRHEKMLRTALAQIDVPVLAALHRNPALAMPSRHLGLVQAQEHPELEAFLNLAADALAETLHVDALLALARALPAAAKTGRLTPPGQFIAVAKDRAFDFAYPHILNDWSDAGAEIRFFSPLANEAVPDADFIYLPGGYPELHAGTLAAANTFKASLRKSAETAVIYGECGGYMTLGDSLTDANGHVHEMLGLLRLHTSFAQRKLHLGYRHLRSNSGPFTGAFNGHEFHYASTLDARGDALFSATDAEETPIADMGLRLGRVCGSFAHIIDSAN